MSKLNEIANLETILSKLSCELSQDDESRKKLLAVLRRYVAAVESPLEVIWRMMMEVTMPLKTPDNKSSEADLTIQPHQSASLRAAMAMGLIQPIVSGPKTATELASLTNCDKQLIGISYASLYIMAHVSDVTDSPDTSTSINDENC